MLHFDQRNSKKSQRWPYRSKTAPRVRNYLARNEQRRLLGLVLSVGVVLILMREVASPDRWKWMWMGVPAGQGHAEPRVDTRVKGANHAVPDAFEMAMAPEAGGLRPEGRGQEPGVRDQESEVRSQEPAAAEKKADDPAAAEKKEHATDPEGKDSAAPAEQKAPPVRGKFFPGVDPSLFREISDDKVFQKSDSEPFYHLCKILQDSNDKTLAEASTGQVTFAQLYRQPKEYRGKLVSMKGKMLRAFKLPAGKNDVGITETWQTWILPENSRDHVQLYVLDLPPDFPILEDGMKVQQQVEFTGFFFKLVAYKGGDAIRKVPLLVARDVTWIKPPPPPPPAAIEKMPLTYFIYMACGAAAFATVLIFFILFQTQKSKPIRTHDPADRIVNEHLASLRHAPGNVNVEQETHDADRS